MNAFKNTVKQLMPPVIVALLRAVYKKLKIGTPIFEGVYLTRSSIPALAGNPFDHENWLSYVAERAASRKNLVGEQDFHEMALSLLASIELPSMGQGRSYVVDFGGGVGMYWPSSQGST